MKQARFNSVASVLLLVLFFGVTACSRQERILEGYFGMHAHHKPNYERVFSEADFKVLRLWDTGTDWGSLEPEKGQWNLGNLDDYAGLARSSGKKILLTLGLTPFWASSEPSQLSPYGNSSSAPPEDIEDWRTYVRTLAERNESEYGGVIRYWEMWNEPDNIFPGFSFYRGTVEELVVLAEATYEIVKEVNPGNQVISPGITQAGGWWLDRYLSLGGDQYTDIVSFHFYWDWFSDTIVSFRVFTNLVQRVAERNGCADRPLWLTETGFNVNHFQTTDRQLRGMLELVISPWYYGVDVSCFYAWNNDHFTRMYDNQEQEMTENAAAYQSVHSWMVDARMIWLGTGKEATRVCVLARNRKKARILWKYNGEDATYEVNRRWGDRIHYLDGSTSALPSDRRIDLGMVPVLICEGGYFH